MNKLLLIPVDLFATKKAYILTMHTLVRLFYYTMEYVIHSIITVPVEIIGWGR